MSAGVKNIHLPGNNPTERAVTALRSSLSQVKEILDNGVDGTINVVTSVESTSYTYRELTIVDGVITNIGDEQTGSIS